MNGGNFTPSAALLWGVIPLAGRERILTNVFCGKCRGSVKIVKFTGEVQNGDVILVGECAKCGQGVVRVLETSERDSSMI